MPCCYAVTTSNFGLYVIRIYDKVYSLFELDNQIWPKIWPKICKIASPSMKMDDYAKDGGPGVV